jgi:Tfp pilus assembly protein PilF
MRVALLLAAAMLVYGTPCSTASLCELQAALPELQTALRIYPNYPEAMEFSGIVESQLGNDQDARRLFEKGLSMTPRDNPGYDFRAMNLAAQLMKLGENDAALKLLNEVIANSPGYSRAWSNRAVIRYRRGELTSARDDAQNALHLDPENGQAQDLLNLLRAPAPFAPLR